MAVHLRRAVIPPVIVREGLKAIVGRPAGSRRIERTGKRQVEALPGQFHGLDFKGKHTGVDEPLQPVRLAADRTPAACSHPGKQTAVRRKDKPINAALEAAAEGKARALIAAVNLFQVDAHDD